MTIYRVNYIEFGRVGQRTFSPGFLSKEDAQCWLTSRANLVGNSERDYQIEVEESSTTRRPDLGLSGLSIVGWHYNTSTKIAVYQRENETNEYGEVSP